MNERTVTTPADLADATRRELLDAHAAHEGRLVDARAGIGAALPPGRLTRHALDALATGRALADSVLRWEWLAMVEALTYGAPLVDVAAACGLDVDEVLAGLHARIGAQLQHGAMTRATADEVLALLERAERSAR